MSSFINIFNTFFGRSRKLEKASSFNTEQNAAYGFKENRPAVKSQHLTPQNIRYPKAKCLPEYSCTLVAAVIVFSLFPARKIGRALRLCLRTGKDGRVVTSRPAECRKWPSHVTNHFLDVERLFHVLPPVTAFPWCKYMWFSARIPPKRTYSVDRGGFVPSRLSLPVNFGASRSRHRS